MPLAVLPWLITAVGAAGLGLGYFADKSGEAAQDGGNAAVKVAVAGVLTFVVLKKMKVI